MIHCPSCEKEIGETLNGMEDCPHCGGSLVPEHLRSQNGTDIDVLDTATMKPFDGVDRELYDRIRSIPPQDSWPLSVMAEILDHHVTTLSHFLNNAPDLRHAIFRLFGEHRQAKQLKALFDEFVQVVADFQDVLRKDLPRATESADTKDLFLFHEHLDSAVTRLLEFHRQVARLRFVRDSRCHKMQALMLDWVQHLLICFERLGKQMRRKSGFSSNRLADLSVQTTLAPPTMSMFFNLMQELDG